MKISELKLKETFWMMFENAPKQFLVIDITYRECIPHYGSSSKNIYAVDKLLLDKYIENILSEKPIECKNILPEKIELSNSDLIFNSKEELIQSL